MSARLVSAVQQRAQHSAKCPCKPAVLARTHAPSASADQLEQSFEPFFRFSNRGNHARSLQIRQILKPFSSISRAPLRAKVKNMDSAFKAGTNPLCAGTACLDQADSYQTTG